ncbi:NYN domain-containing protein [Microbacterium sp. SS28]|uniref:NYN domain-containing protein n=1 Tax=Microbacterium sp. SS28 TaxID=2919948 RepID=UPI001FAA79A2|nr:NYN domain-containing protein [Microbacterium sp. SS28]
MPESTPRVAVYLDFDNIVMSWYDRVHGRNSYSRDRQRIAEQTTDPEIAQRLTAATVDVGAIIDYAASFGTLVLTRAYADWSSPVNAVYRSQLVARAVDLVQLFPAAAYAKNGADIRLAVDAVEDMFRLPDLTHVVIVAGDSDYVPLAQRCKRLGRFVVGVGVAGSTAKSLAAACDQFDSYDSLPGVTVPTRPKAAAAAVSTVTAPAPPTGTPTTEAAPTGRRRKKPPEEPIAEPADDQPEEPTEEQLEGTSAVLLDRALRLENVRTDEEWLHLSAVKNLLKRMDPSFSEKALGHRSFSDFVKAHPDVAEIDESTNIVRVRLVGR